MKGRKRVDRILCAISAVLVIATWTVAYCLGLTSASSELRYQLEAARRDGLPLTADELWDPSIPDADNAAQLILTASEKLKDLPGDPAATIRKWQTPYPSAKVNKTELQRAFNAISPMLKIAEAASKRPSLDFRLRWELGDKMSFVSVGQPKLLASLLVARARLEREAGQLSKSTATLMAAARLSNLLSSTSGLSAIDWRRSIEARVCAEVSNLLRQDPSALSVAGAKSILKSFGPNPDLRFAMRAEFVFLNARIPQMPYGENYESAYEAVITQAPEWKLMRFKPILELNQANAIKWFRMAYAALPKNPEFIESARQPLREIQNQIESERGLASMASSWFSSFGPVGLDYFAAGIARRRVLAAAIDVLETRLRSGRFPQHWSKAGPDGLDPFTDRPLSYRRTKNGFVVYSVDKDRTDNGGCPYPAIKGSSEQDISFEYPSLSVRPIRKPDPWK